MTDTHGVHFPRDSVVDVRDEESVTLLLQVEIVHIDSVGGQVSVELRLLRQLTLVNFLCPKGVLSEMLPVNALHWVFF